MKFKFLEHTADIKFKAFGKNLDEAFENTAAAFSDYISRSKKINDVIKKSVRIDASDEKELLYRFIDELIFLLDAEFFVVASAKVKIRGLSLKAEFKGDDSKKYKDLDHIKAATYAEMEIVTRNNKYELQAVMDV